MVNLFHIEDLEGLQLVDLSLANLGFLRELDPGGAATNRLKYLGVVGVRQRFDLLLLVELVNQIEDLVFVLHG